MSIFNTMALRLDTQYCSIEVCKFWSSEGSLSMWWYSCRIKGAKGGWIALAKILVKHDAKTENELAGVEPLEQTVCTIFEKGLHLGLEKLFSHLLWWTGAVLQCEH